MKRGYRNIGRESPHLPRDLVPNNSLATDLTVPDEARNKSIPTNVEPQRGMTHFRWQTRFEQIA